MLSAMGMCSVTHTFAIDINDGVYQIASGADLAEFSRLVNEGNSSIQAVLTSDVDMAGVDFQPIGNSGVPFKGTFDGSCHYVRNLTISAPGESYVGLFGAVADGAYIKNVVVDAASSISGEEFCGGIAGGSIGSGTVTIENCGNEATVMANGANAAGIIGVSYLGNCNFNITNCYNTGSINGGRESAAISGWVGGSSVITNCYNAGNVVGMDGTSSLYRNTCTSKGCFDVYGYQGTLITMEELESGAAAYKMNNNGNNNIWYQTLGEDKHPVPFNTHGTVYAVGNLNCDGTPMGDVSGYSNKDESIRTPHDFVDGVCSVCGDVDREFVKADADGKYPLATAAQLYWFAAYVNRINQSVDAYLTADIDFSEYTAKSVMIGEVEDAPYTGKFDGREHKITVAYDVTKDNVALFRYIKNATISNLLIDGSINTTARYAGGLLSVSRNASVIENCVSLVNITSSYSGDATHGGVASNTYDNIIFRNCGYAGQMDAPQSEGCAGLIGYAHGGKEILIQNSYVVSNLNLPSGTYDVFARKDPQYDNCYYWTPYADSNFGTLLKNEDELGNGGLCYILNGYTSGEGQWTQTLGTDACPLPFKSHEPVYVSGDVSCDGTLGANASFSNTEGSLNKKDHDYVDGVCQTCGARYITTGEQLMAAADAIASGFASRAMKITLGADIDMSGIYDYPGIGTVDYPYAGVFEGNGHRILNLTIDNDAAGNVGLFGVVTGGAKIRNVVLDASSYIYAKAWAAGIVGTTKNDGLVEITGCGNEADITVTGANAGGILGVNDQQTAMVYITNCYNTGAITAQRESAAISGWLGNRAKVVNTYNTGIVAATGLDGNLTFARGTNCEYINCYELDGSQVTDVTSNQVTDGELCYLLNGKQSDDVVFFQTLGEDSHPVLDKTHKVVYFDGTKYVNELLPDAIESTTDTTGATVTGIWSLSGMKQNTLQKGINVVKMSDGTVRKVLVK